MGLLIWIIFGIGIHIWGCNRMKTWCGTPIWEEPSTYVMFIVAALLGPLMIVVELLEPSKRDDQ